MIRQSQATAVKAQLMQKLLLGCEVGETWNDTLEDLDILTDGSEGELSWCAL